MDARRIQARSWLTLLAVTGCYLCFYTGRLNFGWAIPGLATDLNLSYTQISLIRGGSLLSYGIGQILNGWCGDRIPQYTLITGGALASVVLNWAMSFSSAFGALWLLWFLNGYAQASGFAPGSRLIADSWGQNRRGLAFGSYASSVGLSTAVAFVICAFVQAHLPWRWMFRLPVLLLLLSSILSIGILRNKRTDFVRAKESALRSSLNLLKKRRFILIAFAMGATNIARQVLLGWLPLHALGTGRHGRETGWITVYLPAGMALSAIVTGAVSDRLSRNQQTLMNCVALSLAAIVLVALAAIPRMPPSATTATLFLAGFLLFGPQSIFWVRCTQLAGTQVSGAVGLMNALSYGLASAGEACMGVWLDHARETHVVFWAAAIMTVVAAALLAGDTGVARSRLLDPAS